MATVHTCQVIMSIPTKLKNKEHVVEALHRAKFKFPGHQKIHMSKSGDLLSLKSMNLNMWWQKSDLSQLAVGLNTSLITAPWTNGRPCTHKSLSVVVHSLLMPTNKSYFPVNQSKKSTPFSLACHILFFVVIFYFFLFCVSLNYLLQL